MKKAYVIAYFLKNVGDDMFVRTLVRRYPQVSFTCCCADRNYRAFYGEENLKNNRRWWFTAQKIFRKLGIRDTMLLHNLAAADTDAIIRIGGSIFIENPGWNPYSEATFAKRQFVVGANFGPYQTQAYLDNTKKLLAHCDDVCFRDGYSYDLFKELAQVRHGPDVLFGYEEYPEKRQGEGVGISVFPAHLRQPFASNAQQYYQILANACDILISKGLPVKLFAFCEKEGDVIAARQVLEKTENAEKIKLCVYDGNIDEFLDQINACEYMIATRFHAMVLAWAMGKKVVPVIYSKKQTHVLADIAYKGYIWDMLENCMPDAQQLVDQCLEAQNTLDIAGLKIQAQKQFAGLDNFLKLT